MGLTRKEEMTLLPGAAQAVRLVNQRGWLAILTTNQPQVAKGLLSLEQLDSMHAKLETLLGRERARLDRVYYCPHHPERGFEGEVQALKVECDCRKPRSGMIARAMSELPVLRHRSSVIGDSWRDVGAAREAGLAAYGVATGMGCRDCGDAYKPDRVFPTVLEATRYALSASDREGEE
jgi:histidinol-phosphate phosphatase family protein